MVVVGGPEPRSPTALPGQREANVCCLKPLTRWSCLWPLERMTNFRAQSLSVSPRRSWPAAVGCCLKLLPLAAGQQSAARRLRRCREAPGRVPCAHSGEDLFWSLPEQRRATVHLRTSLEGGDPAAGLCRSGSASRPGGLPLFKRNSCFCLTEA